MKAAILVGAVEQIELDERTASEIGEVPETFSVRALSFPLNVFRELS